MGSFYFSGGGKDPRLPFFEEIYFKFRQNMFGVAYNILHNEDDAEDAVQQAFLLIYQNLDKIIDAPIEDQVSFIMITLKNAAYNYYRSNDNHASHLVDIAKVEPAVEVDFFEKFDYDNLINAISSLPEKYKDIIFLHDVIGFSTDDISKIIGISSDNVRKRLWRAKETLKKFLESGDRNVRK